MKTDIKVGDIVKTRDKHGKNNVSALVIKNALTYVNVIFSDGNLDGEILKRSSLPENI